MSKLRIDDVVEHVRSAVVEQEKTASEEIEEPREFHSKLAEGLHKCAQRFKAQADAPVTYSEVLALGKRALEQE